MVDDGAPGQVGAAWGTLLLSLTCRTLATGPRAGRWPSLQPPLFSRPVRRDAVTAIGDAHLVRGRAISPNCPG